jgi:hypothetical protein
MACVVTRDPIVASRPRMMPVRNSDLGDYYQARYMPPISGRPKVRLVHA